MSLFLIAALAATVNAVLAMLLFSWDLRWVPNPTFPGHLGPISLLLAPLVSIGWSMHVDGGLWSWLLATTSCWLLGIPCYALAQWSTRAVEGIGSFRLDDRAFFIGGKYTYSKVLMWVFPLLYAALALLALELADRQPRFPAWVAWALAYVSLLHVLERVLTMAGVSPFRKKRGSSEEG